MMAGGVQRPVAQGFGTQHGALPHRAEFYTDCYWERHDYPFLPLHLFTFILFAAQ